MAIEITYSDLLTFHKYNYLNGNSEIREYINSKGVDIFGKKNAQIITDIVKNEEIIVKNKDKINKETNMFELNDIVADEETLNQWEHEANGFEDKNSKEYIEAQRIHKINFLKEIKVKGLVLKEKIGKEHIGFNETKHKQCDLNY